MTEKKEYYGPENWQTQPKTDGEKLAAALKALRNIRGMIAGHDSNPSTDYWVVNALLEEIDEQCRMGILDVK